MPMDQQIKDNLKNEVRLLSDDNKYLKTAMGYAAQEYKKSHKVEQVEVKRFHGIISPANLTDNFDRISQEAANEKNARFLEEYLSGDPQRRKGYLDAVFNIVDKGLPPTVYDEEYLATDFRKLNRRFDVFTQLGDVIADNQEYFNQRYPTPMDKYNFQLKTNVSYLVTNVTEPVLNAGGMASENGVIISKSEAELAQTKREVQLTNNTDYISRAKCAVAASVVANKIAKNDFKGTSLPIQFKIKAENGLPDICDLTKRMNSENDLVISNEEFRKLDDIYRSSVGAMLDTTLYPGKLLAERDIDPMEMVFIDGKSVAETFKVKYPTVAPDMLNNLMKAEIVGAMTGGKSRVEVAVPALDKTGKFTTGVVPVKPDLSEIEPSIKNDKSYNWLVRTFAPYACKTRTEKTRDLYKDVPKNVECAKAIKEKVAQKVIELERRKAERAAAVVATTKEVAKTAEKTAEKPMAKVQPLVREKVELNELSKEGQQIKPGKEKVTQTQTTKEKQISGPMK